MNLKPLHDRVIIKRMEEEKVSAGGIVIPDSATEKPIKGEIIAVGEGKPLDNGRCAPRRSRSATRSCSASTAAPRSRSTAPNTSVVRKTTSSRSSAEAAFVEPGFRGSAPHPEHGAKRFHTFSPR
jgi:hypothetical protein